MLAVSVSPATGQADPDTTFGRAVRTGDPDLSPTLINAASPQVCFLDANGDGVYNLGDVPYIRVGANTCTGSPAGMIRLIATDSGAMGEVVSSTDSDGRGGVSTPVQQPNLRYDDRNGNNRLDDGDVLYLSMRDASSFRVQASDVRLTTDGDLGAGRQVRSTDADMGTGVRELGTLATYLDLFDADGDGAYSALDRVYVKADGTSNQNVAFGDARLSAVAPHPPGTSVRPGDTDAVHMLRAFSAVSICIVDADESGGWEVGEAVVVVSGSSCGNTLTIGAARLTASGDHPAGTRVGVGDADMSRPLIAVGIGTQTLAYIDVDGDGVWGMDDVLYLNIAETASLRVASGDVRLTYKGAGPAGSIVTSGDSDVGNVLRALGSPQAHLHFVEVGPNQGFVGSAALYVNADGGTGEGVELRDVRLSTMADDLAYGTRVGSGSRDAVFRLTAGSVSVCFIDDSGDGVYNSNEPVLAASGGCPSSISTGVLRLSDRNGHAAGTFIRPGQPDHGSAALVVGSGAALKYLDVNGNGVWDIRDTMYIDLMSTGSHNVGVGDLRLTPYVGLPAGAHVKGNDQDAGIGLTTLGSFSSFLRFAPTGPTASFTNGDLLYFNVDQGGAETVEAGDVRLVVLEANEVPPPVDDPGDPVDPTDPTDPSPPADPTTPPDPGDPGDPADPADPAPPDDGNETDGNGEPGSRVRTPGPGAALFALTLAGLLLVVRRRARP